MNVDNIKFDQTKTNPPKVRPHDWGWFDNDASIGTMGAGEKGRSVISKMIKTKKGNKDETDDDMKYILKQIEKLEIDDQKEKANKDEKIEPSETDIELIMNQTGVSYSEVYKALVNNKGDIIAAIMEVSM
jgi:NACalpha-BTF3-like transcription factor